MRNKLNKAIYEWIQDFGLLDLDTSEKEIISYYERKMRKKKLEKINKNEDISSNNR